MIFLVSKRAPLWERRCCGRNDTYEALIYPVDMLFECLGLCQEVIDQLVLFNIMA